MNRVVRKQLLDVNPDEFERYHFPINESQVRDLLGKILTQVEAMNLREKVERANKSLFEQLVWGWFDSAQENSVTSYKNCLAPIYDLTRNGTVPNDDRPPTNRWGYICPNGCGKTENCNMCPPEPIN